jgi:predicted GNAT family acetyltransferase
VEVERLADASAFFAEAEPFLLTDEARHNLLLGIAGTIRDSPDHYKARDFWLVRDGSTVVAAGLRTPPYNLVVAHPKSPQALAALAETLAGEELPGVVGAEPEALDFAKLWTKHTGSAARTNMRQGIYALENVEPPPAPPGSARVATDHDRELVLRWWIAFAEEALHEDTPGTDLAEVMIDHRLSSSTAGILLWEDGGRPVSLAGWSGPTPNGIRVSPVYTPPELRGRGYATALTAELSQRLLDGRLFEGGRRFCFLFTDLANPTSNAIYERIGYRRVAEAAEILFG